jgi:succinate dehydrogenase flavin-adding protein (antitoxin of CptAB toxin-antitoxin module)
MGYTITSEGEDVYILDYDAMVKGRTKYFRYSLTGSNIGTPTTVTLSSNKHIDGDSHAENGAKITLDEVFNQVTVIDEFYEIDSLVEGLDSSKNYINITATLDNDLKNWFMNNSRFLESEVFTVKNKAGEDESFFVTLTKADDGKIFFVVGKFYKHPMITTKHYNHNSNSLMDESGFNPMMYSKIWGGKGANVVGYFTKQIDSSKYNQWRVDITSNWDG